MRGYETSPYHLNGAPRDSNRFGEAFFCEKIVGHRICAIPFARFSRSASSSSVGWSLGIFPSPLSRQPDATSDDSRAGLQERVFFLGSSCFMVQRLRLRLHLGPRSLWSAPHRAAEGTIFFNAWHYCCGFLWVFPLIVLVRATVWSHPMHTALPGFAADTLSHSGLLFSFRTKFFCCSISSPYTETALCQGGNTALFYRVIPLLARTKASAIASSESSCNWTSHLSFLNTSSMFGWRRATLLPLCEAKLMYDRNF